MEPVKSFVVNYPELEGFIYFSVWLILLLSALISVIFIITGVSNSFIDIAKDYHNLSIVALFRKISFKLSKWSDKWIGATLLQRILRISLLNWVFLVSMCLTMLPGSKDWRYSTSLVLMTTIHIWIWGNVIADIFSISVTRRCLTKYQAETSNFISIFLYFIFDIVVATACFYFTNVIVNIAYILQHDQSFYVLFDRLGDVYGFDHIFEKYVITEGGKPVFASYGILVTLTTSYIPTIICLIVVILLIISLFIQSLSTYLSEEKRMSHAFIGFFIACCIAFATTTSYLWSLYAK